MRKLVLAVAMAALPLAYAQAQAPDKEHPPQKTMDQETPEMKNPGGTKGLHPPQKAMDEATPAQTKDDANTGASSGSSGEGKTFNKDDLDPNAKEKIPSDSSPQK